MSAAPRSRIAALVVACAVWGSSFLFGKIALTGVPVAHLVLERFGLACAVLLPLSLVRGGAPRGRDRARFLVAGVVGVPLTFLLQFEGLARTTVTSASLIVGAGAPLVALAAAAFHGDRLDASGWRAVAVSTAGVTLLVGLPDPGRTALGDGLVFLSMVAAAAYILLCARLLRRYDALSVTAWTLALGTLALAPAAWALEGPPSPAGLSPAVAGSVVVLGLACTAGTYLVWNWGLAGVPASRAGVYLNLEPLVGAMLGVALLGDPVSPGLAAGGAAIVGASIWISLPRRERPEAPPALPPRRRSRAPKLRRSPSRRAVRAPRPRPQTASPRCPSSRSPSRSSSPPSPSSPRRRRPSITCGWRDPSSRRPTASRSRWRWTPR